MLQPNKDRLDYGDLLMPPEGYQLEHAITTTYSLDLDTLISIPVALYFTHSLDLNMKTDIVQILDSIRRANTSIKVFCQKGQIKVPDNQHRLYSFLESCIIQMKPTLHYSFHPKMWVIRYKSSKGEIKYRVIVLSRNLTFDRSWDVAFQLEGDCNLNRENKVRKNKPLVDFVDHLASFERIEWIEQFIIDLSKTEFKLTQNEFEDFNFLPTGIPGYTKNIIFDSNKYDDLLIVSPFVTNDGLELARSHSLSKPKLFSRQIEFKKIDASLLNSFSCWHLSNDFIDGEEKVEADTEENLLNQLQDLHAKIYSYKHGWNAYLLLGSSNCSQRAMLRNVEFMISLRGKNSKIGPNIIFKQLVNDELKVFQQFDKDEQLSDIEKLELKCEQELQKLKIELVNSRIKARAVKQEDENYKIEMEYDLLAVSISDGIELYSYLLRSNEQKQILLGSELNTWTVHNVAELDLSCFLIVEVLVKETNAGLRFAMKIQINDLPESRNSKIFKDIISTPINFFKYIQFLLSDNHWDEDVDFGGEGQQINKGGLDAGEYIFQETPVYENMLKAASRHPEKLKEIKSIIDRINEEEDSANGIIPTDFKKLWSVFEQTQENDK